MKALSIWSALLISVVAVSGCNSATVPEAEAAATPVSKNYMVLVDISLSRSKISREEGAQFIGKFAKTLSFGDHVTVMQVQELGLADHPQHWSDDMPVPPDPRYITSYDRKMLEAEQENVQNAVEQLSSAAEGVKLLHTDLFTTLGLAAQYMRDYSGRPTTLILLSDMLQSAKGVEMDGARQMPPTNWLTQQKRLGALPDLSGTCVLVVGADGVTPTGLKIREFWRGYFTAAGANLPVNNYRARPPLTGEVSCPPA